MGDVLGYIQTAIGICKVLMDVYRGIRDAPEDIRCLSAEIKGLNACFNTILYPQCRSALFYASENQKIDLDQIMHACDVNSRDLVKFLRENEWLIAVTEISRNKKALAKAFNMGKAWLKKLWSKFNYSSTDKGPFRDKLAIPLQSMNIFLVSLTMIHMPYNQRLSRGLDSGVLPHPWVIIGESVAFKDPQFDTVALKKPGIDAQIVQAADAIINGSCIGHCCPCCSCEHNDCHCETKDNSIVLLGSASSSPKSRRKSSFNGAGIASDEMFLVRSKAKNGHRSKSSVRRVRREIVPPKPHYSHEYDEHNTSSPAISRAFLDGPSHPVPPSSNYEHGRNQSSFRGNGSSPDPDTTPEIDDFKGDECFPGHRPRSRNLPSPRDVQMAAQAGREEAIKGIQEARKQAKVDLLQGINRVRLDSVAGADRIALTSAGYPDVRIYIEIKYGFVITLKSPSEQRTARLTAELNKVNRNDEKSNWRGERHSLTTDEELELEDSDVSDASDDDFRENVGIRHPRYRGPPVSGEEKEQLRVMLSIENTAYTPRTGFSSNTRNGAPSVEHNLEWERLLNERESLLQARERDLARREDDASHREAGDRERAPARDSIYQTESNSTRHRSPHVIRRRYTDESANPTRMHPASYSDESDDSDRHRQIARHRDRTGRRRSTNEQSTHF